MRGITISDHDAKGFLTVHLRDILALLGGRVYDSLWEIKGVECLGGREAEELHRLSESNERISGSDLFRLAAAVTQVIDGTFLAYRLGQKEPWLIISLIDSSAIDIETDDEELLRIIRKRFNDVADFPDVAPAD
jgi:hypothetical protein